MQDQELTVQRGLSNLATIIAKAAILLPLASVCIWWAYSMNRTVTGGAQSLRQALLLTVAMSGITTALVTVVWIISPILHKRQTWLGLAIKTAVETGLILSLYTVAVFFWRQNWTPTKGLSEGAAFMPVLGRINAEFFSDFLWLEYLVCVVPLVSALAGVLTSMFDFLKIQRQLKPATSLKEC